MFNFLASGTCFHTDYMSISVMHLKGKIYWLLFKHWCKAFFFRLIWRHILLALSAKVKSITQLQA